MSEIIRMLVAKDPMLLYDTWGNVTILDYVQQPGTYDARGVLQDRTPYAPAIQLIEELRQQYPPSAC